MEVRIIEKTYKPENFREYRIENKYNISQTISTDGEYVVTETNEGCYTNELSSQHIQISGFRLIEGNETLCPQGPGMMTMANPYFLPGGRIKRVTKGVCEIWCCFNVLDLESPLTQVQSIKLENNQTLNGVVGDRLFIVHGAVIINNIEHNAAASPKFLRLTNDRVITASSPIVYMFKWSQEAAGT
jgi:hypothetical protein